MLPTELATITRQLRDARYRAALECFPAYAEILRRYVGVVVPRLPHIPFEQLPVLSKSDIRMILTANSSLQTAGEFLRSKHSDPRVEVISHSTGGSSGEPLKFLITRESFEWRTAVSDRGYSWAQAEEGQRSFYVWGTSITPPCVNARVKAGLHHWLQNRRYFDSFHFDDAAKSECCRQINRFRPMSLVGYAGNLIELARYVQRYPEKLTWRAKTVVTAAEGLRPGMRALLEAQLADEVFMSYGSREFMLIGMECREHCGYHLSSDNLYVEVVDDDGRACAPGEVGRIVVTDLHNSATPFIRYEIGDLGVMGGDDCGLQSSVCPCGLPFPLLACVEGRLQEVIVNADGEKLTALFVPHLMKEFAWVDGYQVVQDAPGRITMNLVTRLPGWEYNTGDIAVHLRSKLGMTMVIGFRKVDRLERTATGKTPIVVVRWQ